MQNGTINVEFTQVSLPLLNGQNQPPYYTFVFNPSILSLVGAGPQCSVTFVLTSNIPGASLNGETFVGNTQPTNVVETPSGDNLVVTFNSRPDQTYNYEVTVTLPNNGGRFTSSDPEIVIPPG